MDEEYELNPSATKAIFLLVIPPKSLFHDPHRCIQVQRVVHQASEDKSRLSGLRIRPIFNLEYHKLFATRVIELENNDTKVAEFHPIKGVHEETQSPPVENVKGRRRRAWSIDNKTGEFGGTITSRAVALGLCDMTVAGSEKEGLLLFTCADGETFKWRKYTEANNFQWQLTGDEQEENRDLATSLPTRHSMSRERKGRTSYEFSSGTDDNGLRRSDTSLTLSSAYTTFFNNESQLSGMTHTPKPDEGENRRLSNDTSDLTSTESRAALHSFPIPHITVTLDSGYQPRQSMHDISRENHQLYRILLCTLWITWSSQDFIYEPDVKHHVVPDSETRDVGLVDRHSSTGLSKTSKADDATVAETGPRPRESPSKSKKRSFFSRIARICGS